MDIYMGRAVQFGVEKDATFWEFLFRGSQPSTPAIVFGCFRRKGLPVAV
jgi:hypothetical protein